MTEMERPSPLPTLVWVAVLLPSMLVALFEVSRELGGPAAPVDVGVLAVLWAFTTLPLAAFALGLRRTLARGSGPGAPPEIQAALEAVVRAEQLASRAWTSQARLDALVRQGAQAAAVPPDMVPRAAARRTTLLACGLVAVFLLAAGALGAVFTAPVEGRPVHIHAAFAVWADGEHVEFTDPAFDLARRGVVRAHLHVADGYPGILHIEGKPGLTLGEFFRDAVGATLTEEGLVLDVEVHGGRSYQENETHRLRLLVAPGGGEGWSEVKPVASFVPRDGDRILLSFGAERGAALAAQEASVPTRFPP